MLSSLALTPSGRKHGFRAAGTEVQMAGENGDRSSEPADQAIGDILHGPAEVAHDRARGAELALE
jgi:hypothetical protein